MLMPHFRWNKRRLDFSTELTVAFSIWADQGTSVGRRVELKSPAPCPDPAGFRKDYLAFDQKCMADGEVVGAAVKGLGLRLPAPHPQSAGVESWDEARTSLSLLGRRRSGLAAHVVDRPAVVCFSDRRKTRHRRHDLDSYLPLSFDNAFNHGAGPYRRGNSGLRRIHPAGCSLA
jgi:hypothetical protein